MLKFIKINNFMSFGDEVTFSMEAQLQKDRSLTNNYFELTGNKLLKTSVIYGPNASGKSNLFKAILFLRSIILNSQNYIAGQPIPGLQNFLLRDKNLLIPTIFQIGFITDGLEFIYEISLTNRTIEFEKLSFLKGKKNIILFEREKQKIKHYPEFDDKGMSDNVKENTLALSVYATWNSEIPKKIINFFSNVHVFIGPTSEEDTITMLDADKKFKHFLSSMLSDSGIKDISSIKEEKHVRDLPPELQEKLKSEMPKGASLSPDHKIIFNQIGFLHDVYNEEGDKIGEKVFTKNQESKGTARLFDLAGSLYNVIHQGKILFIDELDSSLHTRLVENMIRSLHHAPEKFKFQIIFNTHNTNLLDIDEIFRKDQIYLMDKDTNTQISKITRLSDMKIRKDIVAEKNYLAGKRGSLPQNSDSHYILGEE